MKNYSSLLICLLFTAIISAQTGTIKIAKAKPEEKKTTADSTRHPVYELYYCCKILKNDFQKNVNTRDRFKWGEPLQIIGIGVSGPTTINRRPETFYGNGSYNLIIPQPARINDSISCKITGGIFSLGLGGLLQSRSERFYTGFYIGFNTGRIRLSGPDIIRAKNGFFSPKAGIEIKLLPGRFSISVLAEAEYDVSRTNWKKTVRAADETIALDNLRQESITCLFTLSYSLFRYENSDRNT